MAVLQLGRARAAIRAGMLSLIAVVSCTTARYVGSVGRDGTYANRGYGFALRIKHRRLDQRWKLLDPASLPRAPRRGLPIPTRAPLDLDGDGMLSVNESTLHFEPTLRLLSRTSTGARADLRVEILSGPAKGASLKRLLSRALRIWTMMPSDIRKRAFQKAESRRLVGGEALVATATTTAWLHHLAVIDQGPVRAEERIRRRQLVTLHVYAPRPTDPLITSDFDHLLDALILNRAADEESLLERW